MADDTSAGSPSPQTQNTIPLAACQRCKRRKSRCNRSLPSCRRCEEAQLPCVYTHRRKPGFSAGHRDVLESRIRELEQENRRLRSSGGDPSANIGAGPSISSQPSVQQSPTLVSHDQISHHQINKSPGAESHHEHNALIPQARARAPTQNQPFHPTQSADRVLQATYPRTCRVSERKPPMDLVVSSVSVFFRHVHPWLPFLDVKRVMTDLACTREPSLLLHAIFGASLPWLYDSRLDQSTSDSFWKYTKRRIFVETTEEPSFASLEACTVLTMDLSGMTNGPQVWSRLAVVAKLAAQLRTVSGGVLRPAVQAAGGTGHEDDNGLGCLEVGRPPGSRQHARLFWAIFALDVFVSLTTSQPRALTDHSLAAFRPGRDVAWTERGQHHSPENCFRHMLDLLDVACRVHSLYLEYLVLPSPDETRSACWLSSFAELASAPSTWLVGLPAAIARIPARGEGPGLLHPITAMMHGYSHALTIHLNGLLELTTNRALAAQSFECQQDAHQRCIQSVGHIASLACLVGGPPVDQLGWPFAWSVWVAARYLLAAAYRNSVAIDSQFHLLIECLRKLGMYWQISTKYWWLLRRAADAYGDDSVTVGESSQPSRILMSMVDLSIPASEIEDEFRVDPVLSRHTTSETHSRDERVDAAEAESDLRHFDHLDTSGPIGLGLDNYLSDTWFTTPLFASSGYQHFPMGDGWADDAEAWRVS